MNYVISDIHGCYDEYIQALKLIDFSEEDTLYVLGDIIDRGPDSVKLLQDMSMRFNVVPLLGNHEFMAMNVLPKFCVAITEENAENHLTADDLISYSNWVYDGGMKTIEQFRKLPEDEISNLLDYISDFSLYEHVSCGGRDYILVHAGLSNFSIHKELDEYDISELIFDATDLNRVYFEDFYLVTGHRPTFPYDGVGKIIEKNNHIAVDCGCIFGYNLGVYCLDTGETFYVESSHKKSN